MNEYKMAAIHHYVGHTFCYWRDLGFQHRFALSLSMKGFKPPLSIKL